LDFFHRMEQIWFIGWERLGAISKLIHCSLEPRQEPREILYRSTSGVGSACEPTSYEFFLILTDIFVLIRAYHD
jgi:hypothetical protein